MKNWKKKHAKKTAKKAIKGIADAWWLMKKYR